MGDPFIVTRACVVRGRGMVFRTAGAIATLLLGLGGPGGQAFAQYYPPPPPSYPPQAYPSQGYQPPYRPLPPVDVADDPPPHAPPAPPPLPPAPIRPPGAAPPPP